MKCKRIIALVLMVGVGGATFIGLPDSNFKNVSASGIKQNVVYSGKIDNASTNNQNQTSGINAAYKSEALKALKAYIGVSPEESKYASKMNFKMSACDNNTLPECEKSAIAYWQNKNSKFSNDMIQKIKARYDLISPQIGNGFVDVSWSALTDNGTKNGGMDYYNVIFDKTTNKIDNVVFFTDLVNGNKECDPNSEESQNTAKDFIIKNNLADIKNPQFVKVISGDRMMFKDANDANKKAAVVLDGNTKKACGFWILSNHDINFFEQDIPYVLRNINK